MNEMFGNFLFWVARIIFYVVALVWSIVTLPLGWMLAWEFMDMLHDAHNDYRKFRKEEKANKLGAVVDRHNARFAANPINPPVVFPVGIDHDTMQVGRNDMGRHIPARPVVSAWH